jgi:hypothetical protein
MPDGALAADLGAFDRAALAKLATSPALGGLLHVGLESLPSPAAIVDLLRDPRLKSVESLGLPFHPDVVAALADCPRRTQLRALHFHGSRGNVSTITQTAEAFARIDLPGLNTLTFEACTFNLRAFEALALRPPVRTLEFTRCPRFLDGSLRALARGPLAKRLECLGLSGPWFVPGDLAALMTSAIPLRALSLNLGIEAEGLFRAFDSFALASLRRLTLNQAPLSRDELNALTTSAAFRGLESLRLLGCPLGGLEALVVRSHTLTGLKHLSLKQCRLDELFAHALGDGPLAAQLVSLDVTGTEFDGTSTRHLATCSFPKLEDLRLRGPWFEPTELPDLFKARGLPRLTYTDAQDPELVDAFIDGRLALEAFEVSAETAAVARLAKSVRGRALKELTVFNSERLRTLPLASVDALVELTGLESLCIAVSRVRDEHAARLRATFGPRVRFTLPYR